MADNKQLEGLVRFLENIKRIGSKSLILAVKSREEEILDENVAQMKRGEDPFGEPFEDYSEASVEIYGKEAGPITWEDTGEFHESLTLDQRGNTFEIGSKDPKFEEFIEPRAEPLGLQEEVIENEIIDLVVEDFMDILLEELDKRTGQ